MKFLLLNLFAFLLLSACKPGEEGFEVNFELINAEDGPVYVTQRIPNPTTWFIDTLELKDGKAVFKGKLEYPRWVSFIFRTRDNDFQGSCGLFLDNSRVEITGDFNDLKNVNIRGSKTNEEYLSIEKNGEELFREYNHLSYERSKSFKDDRRKYDSLAPYFDKACDKLYEYITTLPGYATSPVAVHYVREYISKPDKLEKALDAFDASMAQNPFVATCRQAVEKEKKVMPGQPAYNFTLYDIEGKEYRLSDFRGKYVLLEFSASWCGWCKLEIPFLKTVYENTRGKEFVMLTINLDEDRKKWEEDVKQYNLPWPVISDLKAFKGPVTEYYNVSGIPMIFLIGPDGKIKEKDLRREAMIEYIDVLFKN